MDPLVVGFVLNQSVQALAQLLCAQFLLARLLRLLPQRELHFLQTQFTHLSTPGQSDSTNVGYGVCTAESVLKQKSSLVRKTGMKKRETNEVRLEMTKTT